MSIESVMPTKHLILCCPLFLLPSSFPSIRSFSMSQLFTSGGQSIGVSASSVLSMNIQLLQVVLEKQICEATHTAISEVGALLLFIFSFSELYLCVCAQSLSNVWLCSLMDSSPSRSSAHGIVQAKLLEWNAISSSRGIFSTKGLNVNHLLHQQVDSLPLAAPGKPKV